MRFCTRTPAEYSTLSESKSYYSPNPYFTSQQFHVPYVPSPWPEQPPHTRTPSPSPEQEKISTDGWWNPCQSDPLPQDEDSQAVLHWILDPRLEGHVILVGLVVDPTQTAQEDRTPAWVTVSQGIIHNINNQEIISPDSVTLPRVPPPHTTDAPLLVVIKGSHVGKLVRRIWNFKLDDCPWLILAVVQDGGIIGKEKLTGEKLEIQLDDLVCVRESAKAKKWGKQIIRPLWDEARRSGRKPEERFTISFAA
ncbi:hypothetical protein K435DRAFT_875482 [Dendrothele bispora CBS 962.96]|uniref:Uncharacterized protein n=1 Tax=Dendrothele bispora (strain CBS 962.96) TaxID=1314807 RepID=A0A4S8KU79_DENBC|nr:hypothetical protein K435DRAFT_875482 [Dendrothele bispora CBS 962.96]